MILTFKQSRVLILPITKDHQLTLVPGVNIISDDDWKAIQDIPAFDSRKDLVPVEKLGKGPGGKELTTYPEPWELDVGLTKELLGQINSLKVLDVWKAKESRESVRCEILSRAEAIRAETAPESPKSR